MTWVKLDDNVLDHPKFITLDNEALVLWLAGLTYCNQHRTDGVLPAPVVGALAHRRQLSHVDPHVLVRAGLWEVTEGGFVVHDYLDYQPGRADQDESRAGARERKRRQRARERHAVTRHDVTGTGRDDDYDLEEIIEAEESSSSSSSPGHGPVTRDNIVTARIAQRLREVTDIKTPKGVRDRIQRLLDEGVTEEEFEEAFIRTATHGGGNMAYVERVLDTVCRSHAVRSSDEPPPLPDEVHFDAEVEHIFVEKVLDALRREVHPGAYVVFENLRVIGYHDGHLVVVAPSTAVWRDLTQRFGIIFARAMAAGFGQGQYIVVVDDQPEKRAVNE